MPDRPHQAERIRQRELVAAYGQRDIREIKRGDILELMDAAIERGSTYQANRILSHVSKLLNWCVERGIIDEALRYGRGFRMFRATYVLTVPRLRLGILAISMSVFSDLRHKT